MADPIVAGIYTRIAKALDNIDGLHSGFEYLPREVAAAAQAAQEDGIVIQTYADPRMAGLMLLRCNYL